MSSRNERGEYVNDKGVTIKISTDKNGKDHISFYDKDPSSKNHSAVHINIGSDSKSYNASTHNDDKSEKDSHSGSCYLTTACMKYMQDKFDDNCYELTVLRWFRGNFVSKKDIKHYYEIAPTIVEGINKEENTNVIYDYIYDNVVEYCIMQIENGNYEKAYSRYKNSILCFEEQFAKPILEQKFVKILKKVKA